VRKAGGGAMPDFDWLDAATDRLKEVGLDDAAEFLRRQVERPGHHSPRVEINIEVHERHASFANLVWQWADDPMPKVPGLRVYLEVLNGIDGSVVGVEVKFRAEFGVDRREFGASQNFGDARLYGRASSPGALRDSLDRIHFELVTSIRNAGTQSIHNTNI
jgi:hypothetical protein